MIVRDDSGTGKTRLVDEFWRRNADKVRHYEFDAASGKGIAQLARAYTDETSVLARDVDQYKDAILEKLSEERTPTLVRIENPEEMLEINARFLSEWAGDLSERPLLFLVNLAAIELEPNRALRHLLGGLESWTHELHLRPLTEYQIQRFLQLVCEHKIDARSARSLASDVFRLSQGNFANLLSLLRGFLEQRTLKFDNKARQYLYDHSAREFELQEGKGLWEKFRGCSQPEQRALEQAAFIGEIFFFDVLQKYSRTDETLLFYVMKTLVSEGFLVREDRAWYRFTNRAFRDFLAERVVQERKGRARPLHARAAKILSSAPVKTSTDLFLLRASHWKGSENYVDAVQCLLEAAHHAAKEYRAKDVRDAYHEILSIYRKTRNQVSVQQSISGLLRDRFCTDGNWYEILGNLAADGQPAWVKITDFGISFRADDDHQHSMGTPRYMAPERVQKKKSGAASDIFALGIIAFELLVGRTPFPGLEGRKVMAANEKSPLQVPADVARPLPRRLMDLCHGMWALDPEERVDANHIIREIEKIRFELDQATHPQRLKSLKLFFQMLL